jgi:hypothetical protein
MLSHFAARIGKVLGSNKLLYIILFLFILQACWIAASFNYPLKFDENTHFTAVKIYSTQFTPGIDYMAPPDNIYSIKGAATVYHYILSYPYKFIRTITDSFYYQIIFLRFLNILMVALGLYLFARLFRMIKINQSYINICIFLFILLPIVPFLAAHINYDNMLFPLTAGYFILAVSILNKVKIHWAGYAYLMSLGLFTCLIKFTFLPVFVASLVFIGTYKWRKHGKQFPNKFISSFKSFSLKSSILPLCAILILTLLFVMTIGLNIVHYGHIKPSCQQVESISACSNDNSIKRGVLTYQTRNQRPLDLKSFTFGWYNRMTNKQLSFSRLNKPLPIIDIFTFIGPIIGFIGLLYAWRFLDKNIGWYFLIFMALSLIISLFLFNLKGYLRVHNYNANQARYLLTIWPILIVLFVVAYGYILRKNLLLKALVLFCILLIFSQGGGVITHIINSGPTKYYWHKSKIISVNKQIHKVVKPIVILKN